MADDLDPTLLRGFVAVAETGSTTHAAARVRRTQAAVSQQIKRLETAFGCALFERHPAGLRLTAAGERLLPKARQVLRLNREIWSAMTQPEFAGEVRIGVPTDNILAFVPPVLKRFDQDWPNVRIQVQASDTPSLREALRDGRLDLTLTNELGCGEGGETLLRERLVWVGAAGGTAYRRRPLPLPLGCERCSFRAPVQHALAAAGIDWRVACMANSTESLIAMVEADLAVEYMLPSTIPPSLRPVPAEAGLPALPVFAVNLYVSAAADNRVAEELGRYFRRQLLPGEGNPLAAA